MKKHICLFIILMLLILPFSIFLNVNAEEFQITTDSNGKVVNSGTITLNNVNTQFDKNDNFVSSDTFKAYKTVDIFYNSTSNEISYQFTNDFQRFLTSINNSLNIDGYLALTGDNTNDYSITTSTLNVLVSKFATYIRSNQETANAVSGIPMVSNTLNNGSGDSTIVTNNVPAGGYLILPDSLIVNTRYNGIDPNGDLFVSMTYGVMVANIEIVADSSGNWSLSNANLVPKKSINDVGLLLGSVNVAELLDLISNGSYEEVERKCGISIKASFGKDFFVLVNLDRFKNIPKNTHTSIAGNNEVINSLKTIRVVVPDGFKIEVNTYSLQDFSLLTRQGDNYYEKNNIIATRISDREIEINIDVTNGLTLEVSILPNASLIPGNSYEITATRKVLKDPYVDIGSNPTSEDIDKAISTVTAIGTVTTYGLQINNKNSSDNNIEGGVFSLCEDESCNSVIKSGITTSNGVASYVGVSGYETIYVVQTTAPNGYKKASPAAINLADLEVNANGYYNVDVINQANVSLPFTGGIGTIIYVCLGLVVVIGAGIFLVMYKKKNKKEDEKK